MSEQQAIISQLRDLKSTGLQGEALLCSPSFQEAVTRLQRAQSDQRTLLSGQGSRETMLLVKQSQTMMELLSELTSGAEDEPPPPPAVSLSDLQRHLPPLNATVASASGETTESHDTQQATYAPYHADDAFVGARAATPPQHRPLQPTAMVASPALIDFT